MALELLPDGTFKKLTKVQTDALDRYYKRENKKDLESEVFAQIIGGFPIILATSIAAAAYVFREDILEKLKEEGIDAASWLGGGLYKYGWSSWMGAFTSATGPKRRGKDEITGAAAEDICTRWEMDAQELVSDDTPIIAKFNLVTKLPLILKEMHKNGCSKPPWITKQNWDKAGRL